MPVLALLAVILAVASGTAVIFAAARRHRTPAELPGDWWADFEREFRAYASTASDRERRRHRGKRA